ncbi:MAG: hypothetical protein AAB332_00020 [Planctomycetota bacterium]
MNKYIPLLCIPLLPLLGCSTTPDQTRKRADNAASQRLEKRIDDLSSTISLFVNDGNRIHNDLVEVKALTKDIQLKTEGLATSVRYLEERMEGLAASVKDRDAARLPDTEGNATTEQSPLAGFDKLLEMEEVKEAVRLVVDSAQQTPEAKKTQEAVIAVKDQPAVESAQKGSETVKQASEPKADASQKQDTAVAGLLSEPRTREPYLKEAIGRLAEKVFPDNKGIQWNILSFDHKAHLTHTEAEPLQADLGYPRFKFVVSFKTPENPSIIGTYSFSGGQYTPYFAKKK